MHREKEQLDDLELGHSVPLSLPPFWLARCHENSSPSLEGTGDNFKKKAMAWNQLFQHLNCEIYTLYLFYVENNRNTPEFMEVVVKTIQRAGYSIRLCKWSDFNEEIPDEVAVATLSDGTLFGENIKKYSAYKHLKKHCCLSKKLWIPCSSDEAPPEFNLPEISEFFNPWKKLNFSLLDKPMQLFFSDEGLMFHLVMGTSYYPRSILMNFLRNRTICDKKFYESSDVETHFETLSILWLENFSENFNENIYLFFSYCDLLSKNNRELYEYLVLDDDNQPFYCRSKFYLSKQMDDTPTSDSLAGINIFSILCFSASVNALLFCSSSVALIAMSLSFCLLNAAVPLVPLIILSSASTAFFLMTLFSLYQAKKNLPSNQTGIVDGIYFWYQKNWKIDDMPLVERIFR